MNLERVVQASDDPEKTIKQLSDQLSRQMKHIEEKLWQNNRFCGCGADSLRNCGCSKEKKENYIKRLKRKRSEELGTVGAEIQFLKQDYEVIE